MVSSTRQAIAGILVIVSVAVVARAQTAQVKEVTATISGRITIKGKGVPGVVVGLRANESRYQKILIGNRAVTDANGEYRIVNIPPGKYSVMPIAPTLVTSRGFEFGRSLILTKGETVEHFDFAMVRGGVITGRVVDSDGRPVIEESVSVFAMPNNEHVFRFNSFTDDRGIYRIFGLRPGHYRVAAGREDATFSGFDNARFRLTFHPAAIDPAEATVIEVGEGTEATHVNITLSRPATTYTASGRIVDAETGRPMVNIAYGITRYYDPNSSASAHSGSSTNDRGEFKLENLVPGKYAVALSRGPDSDWRVDEPRFEIVDSDVTGLVIKTIKSASISGVVVLEGTDDKSVREQFSRIHLSAWVANAPGQQSSAQSTDVKPDGSFKIRGLAGGTTNINVHSSTSFRLARIERDGVIQPRGVEVRERENVTGVRLIVNYGNASLGGTIEVENGPLPPDGRFYISLRRIGDDPNLPGAPNVAGPHLDERGRFQFEGLIPGAYEVNAGVFLTSSRKAYVAPKQQVVITAGSNAPLKVIVDLNSQPTVRQ
ncbi:MAG TPA: carboxypeptidase-like regulatory domain-containing protein [Pyrinomonadaceae bacterium]|nr:carboxypeptidase-like regulatory domain-containing protein [Pyrinomonadaceae bacterium]